MQPDTFKHGRNGYAYHGCRCDACRADNAAYSRAYLAARPEKYATKKRRQNERRRRSGP